MEIVIKEITDKSLKSPNYKKIFQDIINEKFPEKKDLCCSLLEKEMLSRMDILKINDIIFNTPKKKQHINNQKFRSYDLKTVKYILNYQLDNNLSNTDLATHFKLSRNTIAKWKKYFL